jgi:hypothetical protein
VTPGLLGVRPEGWGVTVAWGTRSAPGAGHRPGPLPASACHRSSRGCVSSCPLLRPPGAAILPSLPSVSVADISWTRRPARRFADRGHFFAKVWATGPGTCECGTERVPSMIACNVSARAGRPLAGSDRPGGGHLLVSFFQPRVAISRVSRRCVRCPSSAISPLRSGRSPRTPRCVDRPVQPIFRNRQGPHGRHPGAPGFPGDVPPSALGVRCSAGWRRRRTPALAPDRGGELVWHPV